MEKQDTRIEVLEWGFEGIQELFVCCSFCSPVRVKV